MDKFTFERLIKAPSNISSNEASLLEELAEAFPYCQSAHLLLAKESQLKKSMNFPKKLKRASTYLLDRKVLHHILVSEDSKKAVTPDLLVDLPLTTEIKIQSETIPKTTTILDEIEETLRSVKESRKNFIQEVPKNISSKKEIKSLEELIDPLLFKTESRLGDELQSVAKNIDSENNVELFLAYLNKVNTVQKEKKQQLEIIDRFLEKEPIITRQIPHSIIPENSNDLSKKSTELKGELVTENFAQILVKQNKFEKAKEIYIKLMLKYPNKSAYFGAKLNELENR